MKIRPALPPKLADGYERARKIAQHFFYDDDVPLAGHLPTWKERWMDGDASRLTVQEHHQDFPVGLEKTWSRVSRSHSCQIQLSTLFSGGTLEWDGTLFTAAPFWGQETLALYVPNAFPGKIALRSDSEQIGSESWVPFRPGVTDGVEEDLESA